MAVALKDFSFFADKLCEVGIKVKLPAKLLERNMHERFATPYVFQPQLTLAEAVIAAGLAFMRIVLGSLLFALCGTGMWMVWANLRNPFLRVIAELPMLTIFVVLFGLLMYSISAVNRAVIGRK
jgi:hypothetical protein